MKQKEVKSCFGKYGNKPCNWIFCGESKLCCECYWKYWFMRKNKNAVKLSEVIKIFCEKKDLKIIERNFKRYEK